MKSSARITAIAGIVLVICMITSVLLLRKLDQLRTGSSVAHEQPVSGQLIFYNTAYALIYAAMALSGAVLVFEHRNLK